MARGEVRYYYKVTRFKTIIKARYLRQEETKAEKILWQKLRGNKLGIRFRRQHPIAMYILDFYAPEIKLAIELDGSQHKLKDSREYDKERAEYLQSKGINIIRFWNSEVEKNLEIVIDKIREKINELSRI
ncbi:MAG: DUF559 domain-containing protein [Candidatus Pacebacteria bacterium]|nr:DUF559 domain-containing protein [Candidatus Paceibacterota bacterium]